MTNTPEAYCDPETERALRLFVVLSRCFASVTEHTRRDIARHDLSATEFGVLELLYHKGPTPLGAIAGRLLMATGSITYVVDQLEKQGFVRRVACPKDRRVIYAELTAAGQERMAGIFPEHAEAIRQAMAGLTTGEQETLTGLLEKLGLAASEGLKAKSES
jgi:MarR family 2-MHQ and catechol resistance regulon transcriptional repressor